MQAHRGYGISRASKDYTLTIEVTFNRLTRVSPSEIAAHMSDSRVAAHMPLLTGAWDTKMANEFVQKKEE